MAEDRSPEGERGVVPSRHDAGSSRIVLATSKPTIFSPVASLRERRACLFSACGVPTMAFGSTVVDDLRPIVAAPADVQMTIAAAREACANWHVQVASETPPSVLPSDGAVCHFIRDIDGAAWQSFEFGAITMLVILLFGWCLVRGLHGIIRQALTIWRTARQ